MNVSKKTLHSRTKIIKKSRVSFNVKEEPMDSSDGLSKKYRTYTKAQKLSIIADLRKLLWPESNTEDSLSFNNISDRLEQISKIRYNELLERIFSTHSPNLLKWKDNSEEWQKLLKQWRRQLRAWIKNIDKPETRGNMRVVPIEKTEEFKQRMIVVLKSLPNRNFDLLRERGLAVLKEMQQEGVQGDFGNFDCIENRNTFSKHFWYDFVKSHTDIAELYSKLPVCRKRNKKNKMDDQNVESEIKNNENDNNSDSISLFLASSENQPEKVLYDDGNSLIKQSDNFMNELQCLPDSFSSEHIFLPFENFCDTDIFNGGSNADSQKKDTSIVECTKMIVETSDNEVQKNLFKMFYENGFDF